MSDEKISDNDAIDAALHLDGDPERVNAFYEDWARDYNRDVASAGYSGPAISARLLRQHRPETGIDLLDAGCGTGLAGIELRGLGYRRIDGFDLSESMAAAARATGCYREVRGDIDLLRASQSYAGAAYDAVLSVGVFTLGHVPPEGVLELLQLTRDGGLLVLSTRSQYYEQTGFQRLIDDLQDRGRIEVRQLLENAPYNQDGDGHYWVLEKSG
ncbi:MAG: methyltransferase domain-containing protein [Gammaproteobacteria bacterium]|jgi:predicted TPR repeat methyltransferase